MTDSPAPPASPPESDAHAVGLKKRVLIVEDDPINARVLSDFLGAHGYVTTVAVDGPEGIAKFQSTKPDLAIVDVLLPRKNGFEVCFAMKRGDDREAKVLLMSAAYQDQRHAEEMRDALRAGGFLRKPFELDVLLANVRRLIGDA